MGKPVGPAFCKPGELSGPRGRSTDQDEARGFHHGPEQITELLTEAVYTNATGFTLIDRAACDRGWVHIREFESTSIRQRVLGVTILERNRSNSRVYGFSRWRSGPERLPRAHLLLIQGDWGTGKSHVRILCKHLVRQQHLPIIEEQV